MANARLELDKAVFAALNVPAVLAVAQGGVYVGLAPQGTTAPYVVFQFISGVDEHTFAGRSINALYQVQAISRSRWPKEAEDIDTVTDGLMEDATLSVANYSQVLCRRISVVAYTEEDQGAIVQHVGGLYRIMADES